MKDEGDKIVDRAMWYYKHPFIFRLVYFFTEKRELANWEVYIIILMVAICFSIVGYYMGVT